MGLLQDYPLDTKTLLAIEIPVMAILEAKRYEGYKKTGEVSSYCGLADRRHHYGVKASGGCALSRC